MTTTPAKIKIKIGSMELEYEGDPSFLSGDLEKLLETMGELSSNAFGASQPPSAAAGVPQKDDEVFDENKSGTPTFSTATIAAHADAKSGPELALCAMAYLELVKGQSSNSRTDILQEMKTATAHYNDNMSGNNAANMKSLAKSKRINDVGGGKYSLSSTERKKIEATIAKIS